MRAGRSAYAPVFLREVALTRLIARCGGRGDAVGVPVGVIVGVSGIAWVHYAGRRRCY
jgi:hypothetical protein